MVRQLFRRVSVASCLVALAIAPPAFAQRKKPTKKPAATAPAAKPKGKAPKAPPPSKAPPSPPPEAAPAPAPAPPPVRTKSTTKVVVVAPPPAEPVGEAAAPREERLEKPRGPLLDLELGMRGFQRHLRYTGDSFGALPPYDLNGAPAGVLTAEVFPYRTKNLSIGIAGSFEYAFALGSTLKAPPAGQAATTYTTKALQYGIGARGDYYFARFSSIGLGLDYGLQSYSVDLPPPTMTYAGVPDVAYGYIRPSLDGRFGITQKIAVFAEVGYLFILKAGEIVSETYFLASRSSASGFEASVGGAYRLMPQLELRLALDYRRYSLKFNPLMSDPYVASGATDTYFGAALGIAYRM
jgi:hypothetical protein